MNYSGSGDGGSREAGEKHLAMAEKTPATKIIVPAKKPRYLRRCERMQKIAIEQGCFGPRWTSELVTPTRCKKAQPESDPLLLTLAHITDEISDMERKLAWKEDYLRRMGKWCHLPCKKVPKKDELLAAFDSLNDEIAKLEMKLLRRRHDQWMVEDMIHPSSRPSSSCSSSSSSSCSSSSGSCD